MRTKDEENEQRQRQQILNTAWQLFYQKGYQNTTMEDILRGERAAAIHAGFDARRPVEELCRRCGYAERFTRG